MCLSSWDALPKGETEGTGYKVFTLSEGKLYSENCYYWIPCPINRWIRAKKALIQSKTTYTSGFHIFTKLADARNWKSVSLARVIYKVKYRKARLHGTQYNCLNGHSSPCIVADEIKIEKAMR